MKKSITTFDIIVTNTGAASMNISRSSLGDGTEMAKPLYPLVLRALIIM